jgi:ubiquinone/menaquinone biosynthesis C-methylase UbiE
MASMIRQAPPWDRLKEHWPELMECIDHDRVTESFEDTARIASKAVDFENVADGGRGELYRHAQLDPLVRAVGIKKLFDLVAVGQVLTNKHRILDVLGGDGVLGRAMRAMSPPESMPGVLTSDISEQMVAAAAEYGLFAVRQPAQNLIVKDSILDGVIIAYGTHHIPRDERINVCKEAFRVLKPGARIVLHDFETGSQVATWFSEVVNKYSVTGHAFPHFTFEGIANYLSDAGFDDIHVEHMYDPFIIVDETSDGAKHRMAEYLRYMYGLTRLVEERGNEDALKTVYELSSKYFSYDYFSMGLDASFGVSRMSISKKDDMFQIEMPRVALVGYATKPLPAG